MCKTGKSKLNSKCLTENVTFLSGFWPIKWFLYLDVCPGICLKQQIRQGFVESFENFCIEWTWLQFFSFFKNDFSFLSFFHRFWKYFEQRKTIGSIISIQVKVYKPFYEPMNKSAVTTSVSNSKATTTSGSSANLANSGTNSALNASLTTPKNSSAENSSNSSGFQPYKPQDSTRFAIA